MHACNNSNIAVKFYCMVTLEDKEFQSRLLGRFRGRQEEGYISDVYDGKAYLAHMVEGVLEQPDEYIHALEHRWDTSIQILQPFTVAHLFGDQ